MQSGISIKAECTIYRNNMHINSKKKSKLSVITLDEKALILIITEKGDNREFKFPLQKLKTIMKKFIQQGRITIEFDSNGEKPIYKGLEKASQNVQHEGNFQILISNACKQNLNILITKMIYLKRKIQQINQKGKQMENQKILQKNRKKVSQQIKEQQIVRPKISRKHLFQLAKNEHSLKSGNGRVQRKKNIDQVIQKINKITLMSLPKMLLRQIFSFSGLSLSQRLISRQISEIVVKNILNIRFKDEVDEQTFNRLAKWAINVQGRLKYVKNLKLQDRYDDQTLYRNRAKSLRLSNWKQISGKNISQIKGLRIYCLQIPYLIKFQLCHLFGIRMVELRLKGKNVNIKNSMVKDEDILHIINNINDLQVIQVAYSSTKVICQIKKPQKMLQIKIGTLNRIAGYQSWTDLKKFQNLRTLSIQNTQRSGNTEDHQLVAHDLEYPQKLRTLQLGFNLSIQSKSLIPAQVKNLKLLGTHFKNKDIKDLFLPYLQTLDIIQCPNLSAQCLQNMENLKVVTNWNRNQVQYSRKYLQSSNIKIESVRGFSYC